jgi:hypothetical protein
MIHPIPTGGGASFRPEAERRVMLLEAAAGDEGVRELLRERWRRDPVAFFGDCVWTYDPRVSSWRHRPMVPWARQPDLIKMLAGVAPTATNSRGRMRPGVIKKSRDQGGSVIIAGVVLWDWLFHAGDHGLMTRAGYQLDNGGYNSLFGKVDYALARLPPWLVPWRATKAGRFARARRPPSYTNPDNGAVIMGATTVDGGWRGPRMRRIWVDEAAWIPAMGPILTSIDGATDSAVLLSSVAGKGNTFWSVETGEAFKVTEWHEPGDGWWRMEMHYRDDPSKDAEWVRLKRGSVTPVAWAQEYECDYSASAPGRIWPEFNATKHVLSAAEWRRVMAAADESDWPVIEGWDYGVTSLTATVWALYNPHADMLYLADYGMWRERRIDEIAADVGAYGWLSSTNPGGYPPSVRLGDPAGRNRDSMLTSPVSNLAQYGINIRSQRIKNGEALRDLIRLKISQDRVLLAPKCARRKDKALPALSDCLEQYRLDSAAPTAVKAKPRKDDYSHAADALQYIAAHIWQRDTPEVGMVYQD